MPGDAPVARPVDTLPGPGVTLRRPSLRDAVALYPATHGSVEREATWQYMGYGPWGSVDDMAAWIGSCRESSDPTWYTVTESAGQPIGMSAFLAHNPTDRRIEVGHIWFVPDVRATTANTETFLLMGRHAFESLDCRRLEWKCDADNAASRASAIRLGFTFEGVFRQHMLVKGRNRDTAWYSMIDAEWPTVGEAIRLWLYEEPRDRSGKPVRSLVEVREAL